ncbi:thiamine phosphate synthase [Aquabacter spiritensis]|uniref:Thiamine-phosphate pyrophosphorylase n=1 Tax=Aquabacter spiritensis TaxID=933073 RepID=A0A4R3LY77_9HYPH|nr:thiamine phosphate synthase [Aquabacter spiritensis]TCT05641.1 thiamine-phosphate pyrophosphorylase [Aquabacter spiritensis]
MPAAPPVPRLMLILPPGFAAEAADALLRAGDVAAVIAQGADGADDALRLGALAARVQAAGAALLCDGRADLAARHDLDGAHFSGLADLRAALPALKPARIAGAGGLATRHDAMEAGEAGADYVLFGDLPGAFAHTLDAIEWWAELFEVPCVGIATSADEAGALAAAGADFVALTGPGLDAAAVAAAQARVAAARRVRP